jgi:hypothetical protein
MDVLFLADLVAYGLLFLVAVLWLAMLWRVWRYGSLAGKNHPEERPPRDGR